MVLGHPMNRLSFMYKKGEANASPNNLKIGGQLTQERVILTVL